MFAGHTAQSVLPEEFAIVVQRWDLRQPDPGHGEGASTIELLEGDRHEIAGGGEQHGAVQQLRWTALGGADGVYAERLGEPTAALSSGEDVHAQAFAQRELGGQMRGCAKP